MDKKIFESHASFLTEFVRKVKSKETSVFRMSYVASSTYTYHYQFVKVPVGKDGCCYIYGAYDKCVEALTHFELPLKVYAIVNEENIFFTMYVSTFGLAYWSDDEWHQFNEMAEIKGHYFPDWCKRFQETFTSSVLAPVYESLTDLPELSEDDIRFYGGGSPTAPAYIAGLDCNALVWPTRINKHERQRLVNTINEVDRLLP